MLAFQEHSGRISRADLGGERLDGLQVEVVVQVEVVQVLAVDQQVEHVVALPAHLQPHLHPVQLGGLEELGRLERLHHHQTDTGRHANFRISHIN